jgi:hypothetical protein
VFAVLVSPILLRAHHADSMYDKEHPITLHGTVTEFQFINPHPHIYFDVKDESGKVEKWIAESGSPPARMYNYGWKANALKPGDQFTVTGSPAKDGRKLLRILKMIGPSGQVWAEAAL